MNTSALDALIHECVTYRGLDPNAGLILDARAEIDRLRRDAAAAPALLAACKRALQLVEDEDNNEEIVKMPHSFGLLLDLQNAIARAEGR